MDKCLWPSVYEQVFIEGNFRSRIESGKQKIHYVIYFYLPPASHQSVVPYKHKTDWRSGVG